MRRSVLLLLLALAVLPGCARAEELRSEAPLPACEWCGAADAPSDLTSEAVIASNDEPGERLVLTGTVFASDGRTPVPGALLYAYHTDARGIYPRRGAETGNGRRHGALRGWLRTDARGRYRILTIRPGSYPTRSEPAHIHMTVTPPGEPERWIDSVVFDDDPLLTPARRTRLENRGGSGIVHLETDAEGRLTANRDLVLPPP